MYLPRDTAHPTLENFYSSFGPGCLQTDARITKIWYIYSIMYAMEYSIKEKNEVQKFQENGWTWKV